jgi:hypothetical protein
MATHLRTVFLVVFLMANGTFAQSTRPGRFNADTTVYGSFGTPGIELKPFVIDHRHSEQSLIDLSFLHDAPAGKSGFIRTDGERLLKGDGTPIRFWGFNLTEWSPGSREIPSKEDAPIYAAALARYGVNLVRLHFLDLPAPRGWIDASQSDSQHFDAAQLDNEDFFISELVKRGIYFDMNLNVGRQFKPGDGVLTTGRGGKGPLLFDKRLIELEKDYAKQLLTHVNPYTKRAYVDEPAMAIVEIVNEDAIYLDWTSNNGYDQELTDLYNAWLQKTLSPEKLAEFRKLAGVADDQPVPRLRRQTTRNAPKQQYYTESEFFSELESGFFKNMYAYLKDELKVKCPIIATSDHAHAGSSYALLKDTSQLDILDGHTYWQHPGEWPKNTPMVNDPFNSTVVELSRTAFSGKPFMCSEVNHPFPNQYACEGIPILAAYSSFLGWDGIVWYAFEQKKDPAWQPYVGDPFDMSLDPVKMPQIAAGALMFVRGDLEPAKKTIERSYTTQQAFDSRFNSDRPYFTPGFPLSVPLLHGSRISSLDGPATETVTDESPTGPFKSDTGQLVWYADPHGGYKQTGLVTIDSPRSQGLIGFVKVNDRSVTNLAAHIKNDFCAIVVNSLEDKPISSCSKMLLTAGVRVENTDMTYDANRAHTSRQGHSPSLIEPVTGTIVLQKLDHATQVSAIALDGAGRPIGEPILAKNTDAGWEIPVGDPATTWYLLTVTR